MTKSAPYLVVVAGIPASGKTTYARHLADLLRVPLIEKDAIKEALHEVVAWDTAEHANSRLYSNASQAVLLHVADRLMATGMPLILENNFHPLAAPQVEALVQRHGYRALTVLFDADIAVLHQRFCSRDEANRPEALASRSGHYAELAVFEHSAGPLRDFRVGERILVDTTDFTKVDYSLIDTQVLAFTMPR
ncbi:MAG: AAA family ATPase [Promicromonosporaceae bacterium]|nr:AAA family ATPase [Promicromonosporaceae bacterium]